MKTRITLIAVSMFGLAAVSVAQDTQSTGLVNWLCTGFVAQDPQTKQALKIQVGSATRDDVARLLGKPWRTSNDADCDADQYGATALIMASAEGHANVARQLLEQGANIVALDRNGWTAMMWATSMHHTDVVKVLLEYETV